MATPTPMTDAARRDLYERIPQGWWVRMYGATSKTVKAHADKYNIPMGAATVDLFATVKAMRTCIERLEKNQATDGDGDMAGPISPALERYREERALLAKMDREEREKTLVRRAEIRPALARMAAIIRGAGDELEKLYGAGALDILNSAIDEFAAAIDTMVPPEATTTA